MHIFFKKQEQEMDALSEEILNKNFSPLYFLSRFFNYMGCMLKTQIVICTNKSVLILNIGMAVIWL